jgi:Kef-type K+ transport system membrane component KefB
MMFAHMPRVAADIVDISSPKGAPWEFLVLFVTLLLGPVVLRRARVPGIIGLLLGGFVIGPHGLGVIGSGNSTLPDLGQLGLLYLMFVAGVELDLNLLRRYRSSTIVFGLLTFLFPMLSGTTVGLALGWETAAAILLGSLLASHTLIAYPTVRDAGLASDPAVATVVGSTVLTDTLTLVVLAAVAGSVGGGRSTVDVAAQVGVGLAVLIAFSLLVLPLLAEWAFRWLSSERSVRYVVAVTAFLSAATVAELFGIEGIVGAFFAGLALNRLVPNEGELMDRIAFFGGAFFIPVFLVSVGLILNPAVMLEGQTLKLAGLFIAACLGGKALAAMLAARLLGFSRPQAGLLFSLSAAQAAATLAATVVGFQLGLFDSSVVNAVLVLIFVSVLVSTLVGARASERLHAREPGSPPLGARVVVGVRDPDVAHGALAIALRIARADGGVVHPVLVLPESAPIAPRAARRRLGEVIAAAGVDGVASTIVENSLLDGAVRAGAAAEATLVLVAEPTEPGPSEAEAKAEEAVAARSPARSHAPPVAVVRGNASRLGAVHAVLDGDEGESPSVAAEMARRVAGGQAQRLDDGDPNWSEVPAPGDVTFVSARAGAVLAAHPREAAGVVVTTLAERLSQEQDGDDP